MKVANIAAVNKLVKIYMDISKLNRRDGGARKIYMIGIKGVGMTMLGQYLKAQGAEVTGSDGPETYMTDEVLKMCHIKVIEKFDAKNIPLDADLIVHSSAYNQENNVEVATALSGTINVLNYCRAFGENSNQK